MPPLAPNKPAHTAMRTLSPMKMPFSPALGTVWQSMRTFDSRWIRSAPNRAQLLSTLTFFPTGPNTSFNSASNTQAAEPAAGSLQESAKSAD